MHEFRFGPPSPALVISLIALFVALGGTVYAASKIGPGDIRKNAVRAKHVKKNQIKAKHVARNVVRTRTIRDGAVNADKLSDGAVNTSKVQDNAITGAKIDESTLGPVPLAELAAATQGVAVIPLTRAAPTSGPDVAAARAAAPEVALFSRGQLSIYGKCFRNTGTGNLHVGTYIKTSANGAVLDAHDDWQGGAVTTAFLNTATPETQREIHNEDSIGADRAEARNPLTDGGGSGNDSFVAAAPDGTTLTGRVLQGAKQGNAPFNGGALGSSDGCQWWGFVIG